MKYFHPITIFLFFLAMLIPIMLINNPVITAVSLLGAIIFYFSNEEKKISYKEVVGYVFIFLTMSILNPLFVHRGTTPLFFMNGKAITEEAILFGANSALQLVTAIIWCRHFSIVMTNEKLFCLIGKLSPKISALLMMTLRFIPDMISQGRKINTYSKISGKFNCETIFGNSKRIMSVFSALITWSLENGIQTADSMKARGFELGGRTSYSKFSFSTEDFILISLSIISVIATFFMSYKINITFYPTFKYDSELNKTIIIGVIMAAVFIFPTAFMLIINHRKSILSRGEL